MPEDDLPPTTGASTTSKLRQLVQVTQNNVFSMSSLVFIADRDRPREDALKHTGFLHTTRLDRDIAT